MSENETVKVHSELVSDINEHCASQTADFKQYLSEYMTSEF